LGRRWTRGLFFPGETATLTQVHVDLNCEFKIIELSYGLLGLTFDQDHTYNILA